MNSALSSLQNFPLMGFAVCFNPGTLQEAGFADKQFFFFSFQYKISKVINTFNFQEPKLFKWTTTFLLLCLLWVFSNEWWGTVLCGNPWTVCRYTISSQRLICSCSKTLGLALCSFFTFFVLVHLGGQRGAVLSAFQNSSK